MQIEFTPNILISTLQSKSEEIKGQLKGTNLSDKKVERTVADRAMEIVMPTQIMKILENTKVGVSLKL